MTHHGNMSTTLGHPSPDSHACGKHRYTDKKDAQTALNHRTQGRRRQRHGRPAYLRAYACPHCRGWHLTKRR